MTNEKGEISKTPFAFDPHKWILIITLEEESDKKIKCQISVKYLFDADVIFYKPKMERKKLIANGDYLLYLKKGEFNGYSRRLHVSNNSKGLNSSDCPVGIYKGLSKIRAIVNRLLKESEKLPLDLTQFIKKADFWFVQVRFDKFIPFQFKKLSIFSGTSDQKRIIDLIKQTKSKELYSINNENYITKIRKLNNLKYDSWKNTIKAFCDAYSLTLGKK